MNAGGGAAGTVEVASVVGATFGVASFGVAMFGVALFGVTSFGSGVATAITPCRRVSSDAGTAARMPAKSMPLKPGQNTSQSAWPRPRMSATSRARKRVLTASTSAPRCAQARKDSTQAAQLGSQTATRWPGRTPMRASPEARARLWLRSCAALMGWS
ncbi:hypothetical protein D3C72_1548520 [compost metagenome]